VAPITVFANGEEEPFSPSRCASGRWDSNTDAFTDNFAENGSLLIGDNQLNGHDEIRLHDEAFQVGSRYAQDRGARRDSAHQRQRRAGSPKAESSRLVPTACAEDAVRSSWIIVKQDGN